MPKLLSEILKKPSSFKGGWQPKAPDEKRFYDKHVVKLFPNMYAKPEYDKLFKGSTKFIDRSSERHGYNPGEDEKVYEDFEMTESVKRLSHNHLIHHDGTKEGKTFAKDYAKGHMVHYAIDPQKKHFEAENEFHKKYHSSFDSGWVHDSAIRTYTNRTTGHAFTVKRQPNGMGYHGSDHIIKYEGQNPNVKEEIEEAKSIYKTNLGKPNKTLKALSQRSGEPGKNEKKYNKKMKKAEASAFRLDSDDPGPVPKAANRRAMLLRKITNRFARAKGRMHTESFNK